MPPEPGGEDASPEGEGQARGPEAAVRWLLRALRPPLLLRVRADAVQAALPGGTPRRSGHGRCSATTTSHQHLTTVAMQPLDVKVAVDGLIGDHDRRYR